MANRKLQTEIDRTLKKVTEGLEIFHDTLDKLESASTPAQKEKIEVELKKEIKKLQRLRDLIKGWQALSELKDKGLINEARRLIELEMERFKVLEKEMKIKAYSKEGLSQTTKLDPREQEKLNVAQWINIAVDKLGTQTDALEAELEALQIQSRKSKRSDSGKHERLDGLPEVVERHKTHIKRLEQLLRMTENDRVSVEEVNGIKEDVDYYIEANQDPDFIPDDTMYDQFEITDEITSSEEDSADDDDDDFDSNFQYHNHHKSQSQKQSQQNSEKDEKKGHVNHQSPPSSLVMDTTSIATGVSPGRKSSITDKQPFTLGMTPSGSAATSHASINIIPNPSAFIPATIIPTPALTTATTPTTLPSSSIAPATTTGYKRTLSSSIATGTEKTLPTSGVLPIVPIALPFTISPTVTTTDAALRIPNLINTIPLVSPTVAAPSKVAGPSFASAITAAVGQKSNTATTTTASISSTTLGPSIARPQSPKTIAKKTGISMPGPYEEFYAFLLKKRNSTTDSSKRARSSSEILSALETSWQFCPDGSETERSRSFTPKQPFSVPAYYPAVPSTILENPAIFERFELDTLFFIFYYQQKTYAQYFAARELKRQSWRFHKKYLTWFQRHEEPKIITEEYEQGTYIYFDYEGNWCQRKKSEFTFEYRYLEDEETV